MSINFTSSSEYKSESKGFFSSSTTKQEKQTSQNIASLLQANNVNIETGNLTLIASKIKANEAKITAEIINLISSKDSQYESNFSDSSGILTRTIETKGYIKEILKEAKIEVSDKLIVNNKDITNQLTTDNIIKTLSSQSNLSLEQINLVKATLNNKEWNDKTTTLSGVGALIVAIVVTVLTAGAGTAIVGAAATAGTTAATTAATTAITTASVQAAVVQSIVTGVTTQLATSVITGNSFKLDAQSLVKGAVSAGVLSYANTALSIDALNENMTFSDYAQNAAVRGTAQGISSEIMGGEFKDGFKTGAALSVFNDGALQMRKYIFDNYNYVGDGKLSEGINGDGRKGGGSHPEKVYNENGELYAKEVIAPTGGSQMDKGYLFGTPYEVGSFKDNVIEHFAGPHDFMSSWNYENIDEVTYLKNNGGLVNTASGLLLIPAIPFAAAPFIQNNINKINGINYIQKQEEKKAEEAIKNVYHIIYIGFNRVYCLFLY
jgi:filamentous hemagglutinin